MRSGKTIYLDHQATTPVDARVLAEMLPYFTESFANPHSSDHWLGWKSARAVENAAERVARLIGADADEITFTSGATESNNLIMLGLARRAISSTRRRILVSAIEHRCVLAVAKVIEGQLGFKVEQVPVDSCGFVDVTALSAALGDDVLLVSIMAVNNEIGTIQDLRKVSELAKRHGSVFHCDAAQAPVAEDIRWIAECADVLCLSSHKMYGPKGVGTVYISRGLKKMIEPLIYGGGQQDGFRSGTLPVPLCVGMGAAADMLMANDAHEKRALLRNRRDAFVESLRQMPWPVVVNGPEGNARHPGNANIQFVGFSAHEILGALQPHLAASTGSACTSGIPEPSHVLKAIGLKSSECESSIRFSLGFGTTDEDVAEAVVLIRGTLTKLSKLK